MSIHSSDITVIVATADTSRRDSLHSILVSMRWQVIEASGGAEAMACLDCQSPEAILLDMWLPDLEVSALADVIKQLYPKLDVLRFDGTSISAYKSARRSELLKALRDTTNAASTSAREQKALNQVDQALRSMMTGDRCHASQAELPALKERTGENRKRYTAIPELIGSSTAIQELTELIQLVAPHNARVLIEGETGTGKELVANALHTFSKRSKKPFVVLNCAAIPEALLEAELFGHTRGAFTGAVQSRVGRIEAAHGGTLFLDEIGEMPMSLQAKLLRFLENGELQRVGDNEPIRVDVRVISATHQDLDRCVQNGSFRLDLLHRLAVFPIEVPRLRDRLEDLPLLVEHFLGLLSKEMPKKRISEDALRTLELHTWPGNIRELGHVLHRAAILAGTQSVITDKEIRIRRSERSRLN